MKSEDLAKLIGPTLIVMNTSEILNLHIWSNNIPAITYLNGIILFVAGLSVVRVHSQWTFTWHTIITLLGWGAIVGGLFRVFFSEAQQGGQNKLTYFLVSILFLIGVFLAYKGYSRDNKQEI